MIILLHMKRNVTTFLIKRSNVMGRKPINDRPMTANERQRLRRLRIKKQGLVNILVTNEELELVLKFRKDKGVN